MKISAGAKKDLMIIGLANALLLIRNHDEVKEDKNLTKLNNKSHKVNKKLGVELDLLQKKLHDTTGKIYFASGDPKKLGEWVRANLDNRITKVLRCLDKSTSLELLANQILFMNFCDRDKPLHESYQWLTDEDRHYKIFDLLGLTNASNAEDSTYKDALKAIEIIKG